MTNVILEERKKHDDLVARIEAEEKIYSRRKLLLAVAGGIFGASLATLAYLKNAGHDYYIEAGVGGLALYNFLTFRCYGASSVIEMLKPKNLVNVVPVATRLIRGTNTKEDGIRFCEDRVGEFEKLGVLYGAQSKVYGEKNTHRSIDALVGTFEHSLRKDGRTLLTKLSDKLGIDFSLILADRDKTPSSLDWINKASICAIMHEEERCEQSLKIALRFAKTHDEELTVLCAYGAFLESRGHSEKARIVFGDALKRISYVGGDSFTKLQGGLKTSVSVHNSEFLRGMFVFKHGDGDSLRENYQRNMLVQKIVGISGGKFELPLSVDVEGETPFVVLRRAGKFTLKDYLNNGLDDMAYDLMKKSLDTILLLHLKSQGYLEDAKKLFGEVDDYSVLERKFLRRLCGGNIYYYGLMDGLRFITEEAKKGLIGLRHDDFHLGNIVVDKSGKICVIDCVDGKVGVVYADPVSILDNSACANLFRRKNRHRLFEGYIENLRESGGVNSVEKASKDMHLAGVSRNIQYFGSSVRFASKGELEGVKKHHSERAFYHLEKLEGIYSNRDLRKIRELKMILEGILA